MTRALALIASAACILLSHPAWAKPKVALTAIEGDASGDVHEAVAEALEGKELALISSREVNRAVDKLGDLADLTEKDFKKLATDLEADAIVAGKLDKVGASRTLKFRLFVHKKMAKGFTISFKDLKSEKFRSQLHNKMVDKIGATPGGEDEAEADAKPAKKKKAAEDEEDPLATKGKKAKKAKVAEDEEEAKPAKKKLAKAEAKAEEEEEAKPAKKKKAAGEEEEESRPAKKKLAEADEEPRPAKKARPADDEEAKPAEDAGPPADDEDAPRKTRKQVAAADDGEGADGVVATAEPAAARSANRPALRVDIGGSVVQRSFKFNTAAIANKPRNVTIKPVPGVRLDGEVYPLELTGSKGPLANLGLGFAYDRTLSLNLVATNPNTMANYNVPAKQSHYLIGLRYRLALGQTETSPTVTAGISYGKSLFSTDRAAVKDDAVANASVVRDTPETEYTLVAPGVAFRMPVTRMVAFALGGEFWLVTSAGPIQNGTNSYGKAKVYGASATASVDIVLTRRIALKFAGDFTQVGFEFLGGGKLSNGLDGDLSSRDVGGLADRSIGGAAMIAVMY